MLPDPAEWLASVTNDASTVKAKLSRMFSRVASQNEAYVLQERLRVVGPGWTGIPQGHEQIVITSPLPVAICHRGHSRTQTVLAFLRPSPCGLIFRFCRKDRVPRMVRFCRCLLVTQPRYYCCLFRAMGQLAAWDKQGRDLSGFGLVT